VNAIVSDEVLVCEGLACPMPVVKTKQKLEEMKPGQVLEVRATDRGSVADLQSWARRTGHQYIGLIEENGVYRHFLRKASEVEIRPDTRHPHVWSNEELQRKLDAGEPIVVLDVREPAEYAFGHIAGARNIPFGMMSERLAELERNVTYAVVCRTGNRSDHVCRMLAEHGFGSVYNVIPGMSGWTGPMERDMQ